MVSLSTRSNSIAYSSNTFACHYNAIHYIMILHAALQCQSDTELTKYNPYLTITASYVVLIVRSLEKLTALKQHRTIFRLLRKYICCFLSPHPSRVPTLNGNLGYTVGMMQYGSVPRYSASGYTTVYKSGFGQLLNMLMCMYFLINKRSHWL